MYFLSNKYIQINNNTKTMISVRADMTPFTLTLLSLLRFHLEIKSIFFASLESASFSFSFEETERCLKVLFLFGFNKVYEYVIFKNT